MRRKAYLMVTGLLSVGVAASVSTGVITAAAASTATAAGTHALPATSSISMAGTTPEQGPLPQGCGRILVLHPGQQAAFQCGWTDWLTGFYAWAKCWLRGTSHYYRVYGNWARPTDVPGRYGTAQSAASCNDGDLVTDSGVITKPVYPPNITFLLEERKRRSPLPLTVPRPWVRDMIVRKLTVVLGKRTFGPHGKRRARGDDM